MYIYKYIYICICVSVCVWLAKTKKKGLLTQRNTGLPTRHSTVE